MNSATKSKAKPKTLAPNQDLKTYADLTDVHSGYTVPLPPLLYHCLPPLVPLQSLPVLRLGVTWHNITQSYQHNSLALLIIIIP